jgi:hypothetical protein
VNGLKGSDRFWAALLTLVLPLLLAGCAGSLTITNLPGDANDPARQLYIVKCAKCHKFYDPARYSPADWSAWMAKMSRKAKLTSEQEKQINDYVDTNLRNGRIENPK